MYTQKQTGWWWGDGSAMRKTADPELLPLAWGALVEELSALEKEFGVAGCDPVGVMQEVQRGRGGELPMYTKPMYVSVEVPTPVLTHHDGWEGTRALACEVGFSLPVGYPMVPCIEQCRGDVEINMAGSVSKQTMKTLSREAHQQVILAGEAAQGALPQYMVEVCRWAASRDLIQLVAAQASPKPALKNKSRSRVLCRMHHIVSPVKLQYGLDWARELGVTGFIGTGQPGAVIAEGDTECLAAFVERFANVVHWGPIPRDIVATHAIPGDDPAPPLPRMRELADALPEVVAVGGAFNGRNSIDFPKLAAELRRLGHVSCGEALEEVLGVYAHDDGHVDNEEREQALRDAAAAAAARKQSSGGGAKKAKAKAKAKKRLQ